MKSLLSSSILFLGLALANEEESRADRRDAQAACTSIANKISSKSQVYHAASLNYENDIKHFLTSSTERPACVVEVGSTVDTAEVMKIIGKTRTPFAIKSGGHASNPGFSSTKGVQISLNRFAKVERSKDNSFVTIGMGNTWIDVYSKLDGTGYNVVGGRVTGPGTGGFTLGGGYSWLTNAHGLTCDTAKQFTLVLPNGTITHVDSSKPDLFFALKGGLNRFGVVTETRYKLVPQVQKVYGGYQIFSGKHVPDLINATSIFEAQDRDPAAQVIFTINNAVGIPGAILLSFYNGPKRPAAFAPFDGIKAVFSNISSRSFLDFAQAPPEKIARGSRGAFHTLSTTRLTRTFLNAVYNESKFYGNLALLHEGVLLSYDVEPFSKTYGSHATDSAYPHANSPLPLNLYFSWKLASEDEYWKSIMVKSVDHLVAVAKQEGIHSEDMYSYPNYALSSVPSEQLYGKTNLARMRAVKKAVDPEGIMELAGGFKI